MPFAKRQLKSDSTPTRMEAKPTFQAVFEAEEGHLLRFAFGFVKRRAVAEELVQEGFMRLHRHWAEVENPRAWIYRAIRNLALSHLRDHSRETEITEDLSPPADGKPAPDEQASRLEAVGMVRLLLAEMEEKDRRLVELKYVQGLAYTEIGEKTGLSVSNVGYRLHHLLKGLAQSLKRAGLTGSQG